MHSRKSSGSDGGCPFVYDPALPAKAAHVIWLPQLVPHSVILARAPAGFGGTYLSEVPGQLITYDGRDGRHIIVHDIEGVHQLWLRDVQDGAGMAAIIPLDENAPIRIAGLLRFRRRLAGKASGPIPRGSDLTKRLRNRLILMLRALDGHQSQASYRDIAMVLYGPAAVARYPWKTSSVRGQTIRLVKDAVATMKGGYRKLLRGR